MSNRLIDPYGRLVRRLIGYGDRYSIEPEEVRYSPVDCVSTVESDDEEVEVIEDCSEEPRKGDT